MWTWIAAVPPKACFFSPQLGWFVDFYRVYWGIPSLKQKKRVTPPDFRGEPHPSLCVREGGRWWIRNSFLLTVVLSHQRGLEMLQEFCRAPFSYFRVCLVRVGFERLIFVGVWSTTGWTVNCVEAPVPCFGGRLLITYHFDASIEVLKDCLVLLKLWQVYWLQQRKWRSFHSLPQSIMDSSESRWPSFESQEEDVYI